MLDKVRKMDITNIEKNLNRLQWAHHLQSLH